MAIESWINFQRKSFLLQLSQTDDDLSQYDLCERDHIMLKRLRVDKQFNILSYGKGGLHGTGGNLVSDFNPIAVMHVTKIDKVR
jgi:hypothetical protein